MGTFREYNPQGVGETDAVSMAETVVAEERMEDHIDDINEVADEDSDGSVVRVVYQDAESEEDQIGFQVGRPDSNKLLTDNMFKDRVRQGVRRIREKYVADDGEDESVRNDTGHTEERPSDMGDSRTHTISVEVTLDDDMEQAISNQLESQIENLSEQLSEQTASQADVDNIEERLQSVEDSLNSISIE
jgi:hypothetical protein